MAIENFDYEFAGARLLGRDMAGIMSSQTKKTVLKILTVNTNPDENDGLIIAVTDYLTDKSYERALKLLQNLRKGILDMIMGNRRW